MTGPGVPAYGAVYEYEPDSNLVRQISFKSGESATLGTITRTFEQHRDVVTDVENQWGAGPTLVSKYHYGDANVLGEHPSVANTGSAFSENRFTLDTPRPTESAASRSRSSAAGRQAASQGWTYDARRQLATSKRYNGTDIGNKSSPVTTQQFVFDYDPTLDHAAHRQGQVGNRLSYEGDALEGALRYYTNEVNKYTETSQPTERFAYDADPGRRFAPSRAGGNLIEDGKQTYTYDGENRLIAVVPKPPPPMQPWRMKVTFAYDDMGRRVQKQAFARVGQGWSTTPSVDRRFVYDGLPLTTPTGVVKGWNLLLELDGLSSNAVLYKYTWGLDLSGSLQGAGGIGGLLATYDASPAVDRQLVYFCDATLDEAAHRQGQAGNVGQLIDSDPNSQYFGTIQAKYEYYPFGGILAQSGSYANTNPFRFSTKYRDNESSLYSYPYRYLIPRLGRWLSRDPIGELGGLNLYAAMGNDPIDRIDPWGRCASSVSCLGPGGGWGGGVFNLWLLCRPQKPPTSKPASQPASQPTTKPAYVPLGDRDCGEDICTKHCDDHPGVFGSTLCDGKGGFCTCICRGNKSGSEANERYGPLFGLYESCSLRHEQRHLLILGKEKKNPCLDAQGKPLPGGTEIPTTKEWECSAYDSEMVCITQGVPEGCYADEVCRDALEKLAADFIARCKQQCKDEKSCELLGNGIITNTKPPAKPAPKP